MSLFPSLFSLVKYAEPKLVTDDKENKRTKSVNVSDSRFEPEEILNYILPPRKWSEGANTWCQYVSNNSASRLDVINLHEQLNFKLEHRKARKNGICPVRRELYSQCFDELIRQITVACAEQGYLMLRLRDEISLTLAAYRTLYESSVAFGLRRALIAEAGHLEIKDKLIQIQQDKQNLEKQIKELKFRIEQAETKHLERIHNQKRKNYEEISLMKKLNYQLKCQIDGILLAKQ